MTPNQLWQSYQDRLKRFILRRVRDEHETEDILQDVFARIITRLGTLYDPDKLEAWIFQVTRRAVADYFRKRARQPRPRETDHTDRSPAYPVTEAVALCLRSLLEAAPEQDQQALRLADVEGRPQKELARNLGLSLTGSKSRVQRARRRLKNALNACCRIESDRRGNILDCTSRLPQCRCG